jgi:hypothetical protein
MIVPITITTNEVIDPHNDRRKAYQELGCTYTQASDLAVTDYVDVEIANLTDLVEALIMVVEDQDKRLTALKSKGKKHGKK